MEDFNRIYEKQVRSVYRFLLKLSGDEQAAEHLEGCEDCRRYYEGLRKPLPEMEETAQAGGAEGDVCHAAREGDGYAAVREKSESAAIREGSGPSGCGENKAEAEIVKKVSRRLKKKWCLSLAVCVDVLILAVVLTFLTVNQVRGDGLCFTNMDERYYAKAFVRAVQKGDYEKAFSFVDVEALYADITGEAELTARDPEAERVGGNLESDQLLACALYYKEMGIERYRQLMHDRFMRQMQELEADGTEIRRVSIANSYYHPGDAGGWTGWQVEVGVVTNGGVKGAVILMTDGNKLTLTGFMGEISQLVDCLRLGRDPAGFFESAD